MSKYFNQSRRQTIDRPVSNGAIKEADFRRVLEDVVPGSGDAEAAFGSRLGACRKLQLPESPNRPLIFGQKDISPVAVEAYRGLRTRLLKMQSAKGLRSVVVTSAVAGEGKTLTSMNLALCCARLHDYPILVVDSDLRTRGLSSLVGEPSGPGLSNVLAGEVEYEEAIMATHLPNLYVLPAGTSEIPAPELYSGGQWKEFVSWAQENFRLMVVDSPPVLPVADFEQIVSVCDSVLVVVRAQQTHRDLLKKTAARIDPKKLLGAVFNGANAGELDEYTMGYSGGYVVPVSKARNAEEKALEEVESTGTAAGTHLQV